MPKVYYTQANLWRVKYTISYHDGHSKHPDGSPFYGIMLFKNKKLFNQAINRLVSEGYTYRFSSL